MALVARPDGFPPPLQPQPLYRERFVVACAAGHPFARKNAVAMSELDGQQYLSRINCEFYDVLRDTCRATGARMQGAFRSEREDWILTMVAAGMGICFLPEFSATIPGVVVRPAISPEVEREVSLVTVAGRRWSSPVSAFVRAARQYHWPQPDVPDKVEAPDPSVG